MKKYFYKIVVSLVIITGFMFVTGSLITATNGSIVHADTISDIRNGVTGSGGAGAKNQGSQVAVVIRVVVNILLFLIGAFAVIMIVIAGFRYVASNGDANTVSSAKNTILYAVIGLVVAFLAYALTNFVINQLVKGSTPPTCTAPNVPNPCTPRSP